MARASRSASKKRTTPQHTLPPPSHTEAHTSHTAPTRVALDAPRDLSVADAFTALRPEAADVAKDAAAEFSADLPLALHNARAGVAAVWPHHARLAREMPGLPLAKVFDLGNYVRGALYADSKAASPRAATRDDIDRKLTALQALRIPAILQLQVFKLREMIDAATVDAIVEGRGTINFAQDGIDLERVFREHKVAWHHKHPFSDAEFEELGALGNWLLDHVQPDGATPRAAAPNEYDLLRRQFWALVTTLHRHLRAAGIYLWGEDGVDARVPKLQSRQASRASGAATPDAPALSPVP